MTDLLGTPSPEAVARVCFLWFIFPGVAMIVLWFTVFVFFYHSLSLFHIIVYIIFCWSISIISTGAQWESSKIFKQHAEEETYSFLSEVSKCRSSCTSLVGKNVGIWTQGSTHCWRGKFFAPLSLTLIICLLLWWSIVLHFIRPLPIHILRVWPKLRESLLLNQLLRWNLNLRGEG